MTVLLEMKTRAHLAMTLSGLALSCCVGSGTPTKAGTTQADLQSDERECRTLALQAAPKHFDVQTQQWEPDAYIVTRDQRQCMHARGWHYTPKLGLPW